MIKITKKEKCSGCSACFNICPQKCISMDYDDEGFRYPIVDKTKCINCGLCEKICPIINLKKENRAFHGKSFSSINKNETDRLNSSSGGMFILFAKKIIKENGVVFGAAFNDNLTVNHILISNLEELTKLMGSKYLQSNIGESYKRVKEQLLLKKKVLFSGTPCQIAGLKSFLKKDYDNLYLIDVICHGVPSQKAWNKYIEYKEKSNSDKISNYSFRNKKNGWKSFGIKIQYKSSKSEFIPKSSDLFMNAFLDNIDLRPSCYHCKFKSIERNSDITLGDFWGIDKVLPKMNDDKGTSLVFVNTKKGEQLWNDIKSDCIYEEVDRSVVLKYNSAALESVSKHINHDKFYKLLEKNSFDEVVSKCSKLNLFQKTYLKICKKLKKRK